MNREGAFMNNNVYLTNSEIKNIIDCTRYIENTLSNASNRSKYYEPKPISPKDLHKIFRDQFGFGKLR